METRTRERLTGAVILVALVVLVVPELLSGPRRAPRPAAVSVSEPPIRSYTLPLVEGTQAGAAAQRGIADPTAPDRPDDAVPPGAASGAAKEAGTSAKSGSAAPEAAPASEAAAVSEPSAVSGPAKPRETAAPPQAGGAAVAASRPAHGPAAEADGHERSASASHARASAPGAIGHEPTAGSARAAPTRAAGGWLVQVGSFASRGNADRLARELKRKGYGAFVAESAGHGHKWYRVRIGPERDRAAAAAVSKRLHAAGHKSEVIPPG